MFYYITPDKTPAISLVNLFQNIFPKESRLKMVQNPSLRAFNILWNIEKNRDENVGFVDFYYKIEDGKVVLDAICLEFEYKIPLYVPLDEVVAEVFKYFKRVIGNFTVHDLYMQKDFYISTRKNRLKAATIITDIRSEAYTQETQFLSQTANESDVDKVLEKIATFPEEFRIYTYSAYIAQLKRANLNTQERVEKILSRALDVLDKVENMDLKLFLTFKLILYYKSFSSSYVDLISHGFLIKQMLPHLMRLPLTKEIAQLLVADTTLYLFNSSDPQLAREAVNEIIDTISDKKVQFLLYPELKTIYTFNTTGNYKTAFEEYLKRTKGQALTSLRKQYELIVTDANLITEFKSQVLVNNYYKKLTFWDRLKHYRTFLQLKQTNIGFTLYTGIVATLIAAVMMIVPYLYHWGITKESNTIISTKIFTFGYITSALFISIMVAFTYWYLMWMVRAMVKWLRTSAFNIIVKAIVGLVSTGVFVMLLLFSLLFSLILSDSLIANDTLWGIQNNSIIVGYDEISFSEMENFTVNTKSCASTDDCTGILLTLVMKTKTQERVIKLYGLTDQSQKQVTCTLTNKALALANINEVSVNITAEDNKSLTSICGQ